MLGNTAPYFSTITIKNVENKGSIFSTISSPKIAGGAYNSDSTKGNESCVYTNTGNGRTLSVSIESCNIGSATFISAKDLSIKVTNETTKLNSSIQATGTSNSSYYILTFIGGKRITSSNSENSSYRLNIKIAAADFAEIAKYKTGKLITKSKISLVGLKEDDVNKATLTTDIYGEENAKVTVVEKDGNVYFVCDFQKTETGFEMYFVNDKYEPSATDIHTVELTAYNEANTPVGKSVAKYNSSSKKWN